jgi:hypothetical protein
VRDAVHVKGIEDDLAGHAEPPETGSGSATGGLASNWQVQASLGAANVLAAMASPGGAMRTNPAMIA